MIANKKTVVRKLFYFVNNIEDGRYLKQYADFLTVTCLEWKPVLAEDRFKDNIIESYLF